MKQFKVGDLVTAEHWPNNEIGVIVRFKRGEIAVVVQTNGRTYNQYIRSLSLLSKKV